MATSSSSQGDTPRPSHHSRTFEALVNDRACACGRPECRGVLPLFGGSRITISKSALALSPQLFFKIANPSSKPDSRKKKLAVHRQQPFRQDTGQATGRGGRQVSDNPHLRFQSPEPERREATPATSTKRTHRQKQSRRRDPNSHLPRRPDPARHEHHPAGRVGLEAYREKSEVRPRHG